MGSLRGDGHRCLCIISIKRWVVRREYKGSLRAAYYLVTGFDQSCIGPRGDLLGWSPEARRGKFGGRLDERRERGLNVP